MIDQDQHVQMQHGIFVADFEERRMNRLLPVIHQRSHQIQAVLVAMRLQRVGVSRFFYNRVTPRGTMLAHHDQVSFHGFELRNARQMSPALKAELLEQFQTRFVVPKDQTDECVDPERWRTGDCFPHQTPGHAAAPQFFIDVNADLGRTAIRTTRQEPFETEPTSHAPLNFRDPERITIR